MSGNPAETVWTWQYEARLPSVQGAGCAFIDRLLDRMRRDEWTEKEVFDVHLAVEEAMANAIRHGNELDPDKDVHAIFRLAARCVRIEIIDQGKGFDPDDVPDPTLEENLTRESGRGVLLIQKTMNLVRYADSGKHLIMEKYRDAT